MNRHEAGRSYISEGFVASVWALLFVVMIAASLLGGKTKLIATAEIATAPSGVASH